MGWKCSWCENPATNEEAIRYGARVEGGVRWVLDGVPTNTSLCESCAKNYPQSLSCSDATWNWVIDDMKKNSYELLPERDLIEAYVVEFGYHAKMHSEMPEGKQK